MTFDDVLSAILVMLFGVLFYLAGKGDLLNLISRMLIDKAKSMTEKPIESVTYCKDCDNRECEGREGLIVCGIDGTSHPKDWFCADGEKEKRR